MDTTGIKKALGGASFTNSGEVYSGRNKTHCNEFFSFVKSSRVLLCSFSLVLCVLVLAARLRILLLALI